MEPNRVILINGDNSEWYEQAIFIVKKNIPAYKVPVDFVMEAEKVINRYLANKVRETSADTAEDFAALKGGRSRPRRRSRFSMVLNFILLAGCLGLAAVLYLNR